MNLYTEEDLRDFVTYAKDHLSKLKKEDAPPVARTEDEKALEELIKILVTMRYNAMVFESFVKVSSKREYILKADLTQLPLHLNDEGLVSQVIVKWRLQRNK